VPGHRKEDGASRPQQFVCDLAAGRACANDQHSAVGEVVRVPVARRIGLQQNPGQALRQARDARPLEGAGRDDDAMGVNRPARHGQDESPIVGQQRGDLGPCPHWNTLVRRVVLDDAQDVAPVSEVIRLVAGIRVPRQFE
jgi:hypothetical protein